jgi:2-methylcitrate dehydratase PrpD
MASGSPSLSLADAWTTLARATPAERIDAPALAQARVALLDLLGATLAGSAGEVGRIAGDYAIALGGPREGRILGRAERVAAPHAAFANGVAGHVLELDDGHAGAAGHPGVVTIPAALALSGEQATYGELLRAIVLGYELFAAVGSALNPAHLRRGFHTTATIGPLAGALAGGVVAGLDAAQLTAALGLAGLQGAGLFEAAHGGHGAKPFQVGRACAAGVTAVQLARAGLAGPATVLEGEAGLLRAMGDGAGDAGPPAASTGWAIRDVYLKRHPACRHTHPTIDLALDLAERHAHELADVERVAVETYATAERICGIREPQDEGQARFSIPFLVATALSRGRVRLEDLTTDALADERVRALARRVTVTVADDVEARYPRERGARVTLALSDGRRIAAEQYGAIGDRARPLSPAHVRAKFSALAAVALPAAEVDALGEAVLEAEARTPLRDVLAPLDGV